MNLNNGRDERDEVQKSDIDMTEVYNKCYSEHLPPRRIGCEFQNKW